MNTQRKLARDYLNNSTLTSFWDVVREAKITLEDQKILDARFIAGKSITQISMEQGHSPEKIKKVIQKAYDKVWSLISQ